jgi:hypothetical protein
LLENQLNIINVVMTAEQLRGKPCSEGIPPSPIYLEPRLESLKIRVFKTIIKCGKVVAKP